MHGCADETDTLLDVPLLNLVAEAHLGERLGDSDEGLELPWCRSDRLLRVAHRAHILVFLNEDVDHFIRDDWLDKPTSVRNVLR